MKHRNWLYSITTAAVLALSACGGGGGSSTSTSSSATSPGATSSGAITAFGSVFVNGHEFSTVGAKLMDDDAGTTSTSTANLEVGQVLDVDTASNSSSANPVASALHIHPLARGYVDASNTTASTITVMGQTVQATSATTFSDHRACVSASSNPCTAISSIAGLTATQGGSAGSYVTVHGYLYSATAGANTANVVATLISVADAPSSNFVVNFKVEGEVTAVSSSTLTIGGLSVNLSNAHCFVSGAQTTCASAFSSGQIVSVFSATGPSLPATTWSPSTARLSAKLPINTSGASVEFDGSVSSVTLSPPSFVVRGINVDASSLPAGTSLPAVGDLVSVQGTITNSGLGLSASSLTVLHAALSASYALEGNISAIANGSSANTYTITVLGINIDVNANTRLADRSVNTWTQHDPASNPFNISTFMSYLSASASQHVVVNAQADATGQLSAESITIVPASSIAAIAGLVDTSPAPSNSATTGTPSTFDVDGLAISADPMAIRGNAGTINAGDQVVVIGSFSAGSLSVSATRSPANQVDDYGAPTRRDINQF